MSIRKLSSILITALILFGATSAFAVDYKTTLTLTVAGASTYDEVYTFTQPENLTITQSGWNSLGNITASYGGSNAGFDSSKKLVVTVTSTNTFALKAEGIDSTISYFHATSENDTSATTTFEFSAAEINATGGTSKAVGVNVADYSSAAAGTYTDEITYAVEVQSATTTTTVTWNASDITGNDYDTSFTKDGVTITAASGISFTNKSSYGSGTFTTTLGNFTKIEITANDLSDFSGGEGWSGGTWTGTASNNVAFNGNIYGISTIVFTIEQ